MKIYLYNGDTMFFLLLLLFSTSLAWCSEKQPVLTETSQNATCAESKSHKVHYLDGRKLRKYTYSSLYWFILFSIMYYKTEPCYPWLANVFGILALDNGINMLHYYHESLCAAHEEERAFDIVRDYIKFHSALYGNLAQITLYVK